MVTLEKDGQVKFLDDDSSLVEKLKSSGWTAVGEVADDPIDDLVTDAPKKRGPKPKVKE